MADSDSAKHFMDQSQESYSDDAKARRTVLVDEDGDFTGGTGSLQEALLSRISNLEDQIKIVNMYLSCITRETFTIEDLEEE